MEKKLAVDDLNRVAEVYPRPMLPANILLADDEPDFELLISQRFRRQIREGEFSFDFAHHGEEALAALDAEPDIDLMLLDINMPVMTANSPVSGRIAASRR